MTSGMPELGSKISLISKADIRYEGRLFTVDPQECTIALANVRSFGTEDRETQYPIAPQSQVYDYILFRGSDIKDIRVVNNVPPMPNDPAIMQMQLPNQMQQSTFQPQFPVPVMGHMPQQLGQFNQPYGGIGNLGGITSSLAPGSIPASLKQKNMQQQQQSELIVNIPEQSTEHKDQASVLDIISGGSRSGTPVSLITRKSPTADMGVQVNQPSNQRNDSNKGRGGNQKNQRERKDSGKIDGQQNNQITGQDKSNKRGQDHQRQNNNNNQQGNQQNRGWVNRGGNMRGRARGRQNQGFRQVGANQQNKGRTKTTIKFDSDYDFEQANTKFEELRSKLSKLKVGEEAKPEQVNGETDKKDDSGNETGAGDHEPEEEEITVGYDKTKSFFDNISCEAATDRTKGKPRTDWRQERKLNSETFGISSTRRGGFYRGRGSYFNRGMGGMNNGGFRGGYRGNYRGRNNNNNNNRSGQQNMSSLPQNKQGGTSTAVIATASGPGNMSYANF